MSIGLHDVIECADAHCFDRRLNFVVPADHQHDGVGRERMNARHEFQSTHSSHVDVAYNQIETLPIKLFQRFLGRTNRTTFVSIGKQIKQETPNEFVVVDYQDVRLLIMR